MFGQSIFDLEGVQERGDHLTILSNHIDQEIEFIESNGRSNYNLGNPYVLEGPYSTQNELFMLEDNRIILFLLAFVLGVSLLFVKCLGIDLLGSSDAPSLHQKESGSKRDKYKSFKAKE
mmetsp:Transcript_11020/g.18420  ORF Transcript_11020/g.18420 Transcript_11020/m.18420 type:complete len:119 (-) Transcript_11020:62-418(-)